jgi:predicted SAM-dependent methyltransferase
LGVGDRDVRVIDEMKYLIKKRQDIVRKMLHTKNLDIGSGEYPITKDSVIADININGIDSCALPYEDCSFDSITALEILEHLDFDSLLYTLHEIKRVLKPKGQFIMSVPNYRWYMRDFQNVSWWLRTHTTLHYNGNGHINMQPPQHYRSLLRHYGFEIQEERRVFLYDYVIRAVRQ